MYLTLILLPLIGSIYSGLYGRKIGTKGSQLITTTLVIITTILAIIVYIEVGLNNIPVSIKLFRWIDSESLNIWWGFYFDSLTVYSVNLFNFMFNIAVLVKIQLYKTSFSIIIFNWKLIFIIFFSLFLIKSLLCCTYGKLLIKSLFLKSLQRRYTSKSNKNLSQENFLQWFVGFTDAEGNFSINIVWNKDKTSIKISFIFKIALHIDDIKSLYIIQERLGIGNITINKNMCIFTVSNKEGIIKLINIFDTYILNTSKYLDYQNFKEAFILNSNKNLSDVIVKNKILALKDNMNKKRTNFNRSVEMVISKYWLLGFIEGDGSFFLKRDTLTPVFALELTASQLPVMLKIKEYLENNLGFDEYSKHKLDNSSIIIITHVPSRKSGSLPSVSLAIKNIRVLNNYLIPFFDNLVFLSKKGQDFIDFSIICHAIYNGIHRVESLKFLILKLSYTMNNFRLSTNLNSVEHLSNEEKEKLMTATPTVKYLNDGRQIDITTNKVIPQQASCIYEVCKPCGSVILVDTLVKAAKEVGTTSETLSRHLENSCSSKNQYIELKNFKVKRIPVFS